MTLSYLETRSAAFWRTTMQVVAAIATASLLLIAIVIAAASYAGGKRSTLQPTVAPVASPVAFSSAVPDRVIEPIRPAADPSPPPRRPVVFMPSSGKQTLATHAPSTPPVIPTTPGIHVLPDSNYTPTRYPLDKKTLNATEWKFVPRPLDESYGFVCSEGRVTVRTDKEPIQEWTVDKPGGYLVDKDGKPADMSQSTLRASAAQDGDFIPQLLILDVAQFLPTTQGYTYQIKAPTRGWSRVFLVPPGAPPFRLKADQPVRLLVNEALERDDLRALPQGFVVATVRFRSTSRTPAQINIWYEAPGK